MGIRRFAAEVNAGGDTALLGRVTAVDGNGPVSPADPGEGRLLLPGDLASVTLTLYDLTGGPPPAPPGGVVAGYPKALATTAVVYAALQSGSVWNRIDYFGGNFQVVLPAADLALGDHVYLAVVKFVTSGGGVNWGEWKLTARHVGPP